MYLSTNIKLEDWKVALIKYGWTCAYERISKDSEIMWKNLYPSKGTQMMHATLPYC